MGLDAMAYYNKDRMRLLEKSVVYDALRANNRPEVFCIDKDCPDTNWGGIGRLHYRDDSECPPFRQFGGWWK